jgi:YHS domain-containing protein
MVTRDAVCGVIVSPLRAAGLSEYGGEAYLFCSAHCKSTFDHDPESYLAPDQTVSARNVYDIVDVTTQRRAVPAFVVSEPYVARQARGVLELRAFRFDPAIADPDEMWRAIDEIEDAIYDIRRWLRRRRSQRL